ncbi:MAG TPA: DNA gyrase C-terminal beta-propeller domain-containing protein, partial [Pseudonocardiaceae bacterium]|nr:DNA gyrase C-terminal beta-propeller domain-containing protein [Pseudonocardiaceae bacterium]
SGGVIRTTAKEVRKAGRQTKGVRLMNLGEGASLVAVARNTEAAVDPDVGETGTTATGTADAGGAPTKGEL